MLLLETKEHRNSVKTIETKMFFIFLILTTSFLCVLKETKGTTILLIKNHEVALLKCHCSVEKILLRGEF